MILAPNQAGNAKTEEAMGFQEAIATCFSKYVDFQGRAARAEYWYWVLFVVITGVVLRFIGHILFGGVLLSSVFHLAVFLPGLAVAARRLHDTDRSGWWLLLALIPIVGWLVLIFFMVQPGTPGPNQFEGDVSTA
jgi:uncharacterized membrane protein YhaH (DUF805 family)